MELSKDHEGDYTCLAHNINGTASAQARVKVVNVIPTVIESAGKPATGKPAAGKPIVDESVVGKPIGDELVADEPLVGKLLRCSFSFYHCYMSRMKYLDFLLSQCTLSSLGVFVADLLKSQ